jgi:hypothetical protein
VFTFTPSECLVYLHYHSSIDSAHSLGLSIINKLDLAAIFDLSLSDKNVHKVCNKLVTSLLASLLSTRSCKGKSGNMPALCKQAMRSPVTCSNRRTELRCDTLCHTPVNTAKALARNSLLEVAKPIMAINIGTKSAEIAYWARRGRQRLETRAVDDWRGESRADRTRTAISWASTRGIGQLRAVADDWASRD